MAKYRKKPVVVEAIQTAAAIWLAEHDWQNLPEWLRAAYERGGVVFARESVSLLTLEGTMEARPADFIICGVRGEVYPCKPDIFAATYEPVDE